MASTGLYRLTKEKARSIWTIDGLRSDRTILGIGISDAMSIPNSLGKSAASQSISDQIEIVSSMNYVDYVEPALRETISKLREAQLPPSNNMGVTYPPPPLFLPHGEISGDFSFQKAKIDWLAFTAKCDVPVILYALSFVWDDVVFSENDHGMPGYPKSKAVKVDGVQFGQIGYAASHGRAFVSLTGTAAKTLTNSAVTFLHSFLSLHEVAGRLSRIDLCFDFYRGERTFDHAMWSFDKGMFKRPKASIHPERKVVGTSVGGRNLGRTMYVGKRGGHCMARVYEKGLQVYANLSEEHRVMSEVREFQLLGPIPEDGEVTLTADTWLRLEAEYRCQGKEKRLPLDMLLRRDQYFAGAFPYFADAIEVGDGIRPIGSKSELDVELVALIGHAKRSYGSLIHSLKQLGFRDCDVVEYLSTGRNNDKLVKSGLLAKLRGSVDEFNQGNPDWDIPF